jgi:hypothetical protein
MIKNRLIQFLLFSVSAAILSECTYGPKQKDKSFLEALNGEHYDTGLTTSSVSGGSAHPYPTIPILKRRRATVQIRGKLILNQSPMPFPLAHQELELIQDSKIQETVRTDGGGVFTFLGDFSDGAATIRLNSGRYKGEKSIQIRGFRMEGIELYVSDEAAGSK